MATPTLRFIDPADAEPTHLEPEPVVILDLPVGGPTQADFNELVSRVEALENPTPA